MGLDTLVKMDSFRPFFLVNALILMFMSVRPAQAQCDIRVRAVQARSTDPGQGAPELYLRINVPGSPVWKTDEFTDKKNQDGQVPIGSPRNFENIRRYRRTFSNKPANTAIDIQTREWDGDTKPEHIAHRASLRVDPNVLRRVSHDGSNTHGFVVELSFTNPTNGVYENWGTFGPFSPNSLCVQASRTRTRACRQPTCGGLPCPGPSIETQVRPPAAPGSGQWSSFTNWSPWSGPLCGPHSRSRTRTCNIPCNGACTGSSIETQSRSAPGQPKNGQYSAWSQFGPFSSNDVCVTATRTRTRTCDPPTCGGRNCVGPSIETDTRQAIPRRDGAFTAWSNFGPFNTDDLCATATRTRTRSCNPPVCGGRNCVGPTIDTDTRQAIPRKDGAFNPWSEFGPFSNSDPCQAATRTRTRSCNPPVCGGADCQGPTIDSDARPADPPTDGEWSDFTWAAWTLDCNTRSRRRTGTRTCSMPAPRCNGKLCEGESTAEETMPVEEQIGMWSEWTWSAWAPFCGNQTRRGRRICDSPMPDPCSGPCTGESERVESQVDPCDLTPPIITLTPPLLYILESADQFSEPGFIAADDRDGDITDSVTVSGVPDPLVIGEFNITYEVMDSSNNTGSATRQLRVIAPVPPTVVFDENDDTVQASREPVAFTEAQAGARATSAVDGDLSDNIVFEVIIGNVTAGGLEQIDSSALGAAYQLVAKATDSRGVSGFAERPLVVRDTIPPVITLIGPQATTLNTTQGYFELGAVAFDAFDGNMTDQILINASAMAHLVNASADPGVYQVAYFVEDSSGNVGTSERSVEVVSSEQRREDDDKEGDVPIVIGSIIAVAVAVLATIVWRRRVSKAETAAPNGMVEMTDNPIYRSSSDATRPLAAWASLEESSATDTDCSWRPNEMYEGGFAVPLAPNALYNQQSMYEDTLNVPLQPNSMYNEGSSRYNTLGKQPEYLDILSNSDANGVASYDKLAPREAATVYSIPMEVEGPTARAPLHNEIYIASPKSKGSILTNSAYEVIQPGQDGAIVIPNSAYSDCNEGPGGVVLENQAYEPTPSGQSIVFSNPAYTDCAGGAQGIVLHNEAYGALTS